MPDLRAPVHLVVAISLACAGLALPAHAQKTFEGSIAYNVDMGDRQMQISFSARGRKVRQDITMTGSPVFSEGTFQLFDYDKEQIITVVPGMKRYMVMDLKALRQSMAKDAARDSTAEKLLGGITATGRKETVAGLTCEVYVVKDRPGDEWCITSALGHFLGFEGGGARNASGGAPSPGSNPALAQVMRTFKDGAVALRVRMTGPDGKALTMVATKVDRTPPAASLFSVPAGFEEMQNPMLPRP
jgi:hypothetical protein